MSVKGESAPPRQGTARVQMEAATLYSLCLQGNEKAWEALFGWCRVKAAQILEHEADDVAQQVCLNMLEGGLDKLRNPKAFLGYVKRAVINEVNNRLRARKNLTSLQDTASGHEDDDRELTDRLASPQPSPEVRATARVALEHIWGLVSTLPSYCGRIMEIYFRYRLGMVSSYQEMAEELTISINTLSVQIKRCLDQLRRHPEVKSLKGLIGD